MAVLVGLRLEGIGEMKFRVAALIVAEQRHWLSNDGSNSPLVVFWQSVQQTRGYRDENDLIAATKLVHFAHLS